MNQQKIGRFIKDLRTDRKLTQEQLAKYFDVGIEELLDGERRNEDMDKKAEETLLKVADYSNVEKEFFSKRIQWMFIAEFIGMVIYMVIDLLGLMDVQPYESIVNVVLGLVLGASITGLLYSSRYITKVKAAKMRLLKHIGFKM